MRKAKEERVMYMSIEKDVLYDAEKEKEGKKERRKKKTAHALGNTIKGRETHDLTMTDMDILTNSGYTSTCYLKLKLGLSFKTL